MFYYNTNFFKGLLIVLMFFCTSVFRYMPDTLEFNIVTHYNTLPYYVGESFFYFYMFYCIMQLVVVLWPYKISLKNKLYISSGFLILSALSMLSHSFYIFILSRFFLAISSSFLFPMIVMFSDQQSRPSFVCSMMIFCGALGFALYEYILSCLVLYFSFYEVILIFLFISIILGLGSIFLFFNDNVRNKSEDKSFTFLLDKNLYLILLINFCVSSFFLGFPELIMKEYFSLYYTLDQGILLKSIFFTGIAFSSIVVVFLINIFSIRSIMLFMILYLFLSVYLFFFIKISFYIMVLLMFLLGVCGAFYLVLFYLYNKNKSNTILIGLLNFSFILSGSVFSYVFNYIKFTYGVLNVIYLLQIMMLFVVGLVFLLMINIRRY